MSHPLVDIAGAAAVVIAVGAGTLLVLPRAEPAVQTIALDVESAPSIRAEPQPVKSDGERIEELGLRLGEIAAAQKRLAADLRAAIEERSARKDRRRQTR